MRFQAHGVSLLGASLAASLWTLPLFAAEVRHAEGHVHGIAEINIVVEGKRIVVEFNTPTEGIMGFEHEARTDGERKKRDAALKTIESRFNEMVVLDSRLSCKSQPGNVSIARSDEGEEKSKASRGEHTGEHREVRATFHYECGRAPDGSRVRFGVSKLFPDVHEIKVQVIGNTKQLGATIKQDQGEVTL